MKQDATLRSFNFLSDAGADSNLATSLAKIAFCVLYLRPKISE